MGKQHEFIDLFKFFPVLCIFVYTISLLTVSAGYVCVYMSSYLNKSFEKSFMHTLNMNKHVLADESTRLVASPLVENS